MRFLYNIVDKNLYRKESHYYDTKITQFDNYNFDGGNLSSDGGFILLSQFIQKNHLLDFLNSLPFFDSRKTFIHSNDNILTQIISRNLMGYFSQDEQEVLIHDPLLFGDSSVASQSTVSRLYDRITRLTNIELKHSIQKQACKYINRHVASPILDADSTMITTDGEQEAASYIHHYQEVGYHPLVINEYNSKLLVSAQLRTGKSYSSNGIIEELKEIMPLIQGKYSKHIRFRGDSAFYSDEIMSYLETMNCHYFIRTKSFSKLTDTIIDTLHHRNIDTTQYTPQNPYYGEIRYTMTNSKRSRRVCYKAFHVTDKHGQLSLLPVIYCVITNKENGNPKSIMDFYEERGNSENFTKEIKDDFNGGKLSHREFLKNEIEFLISSLSYNLFHIFQNIILENEDRKIRMNTFRSKYQKIAVRVVKHARQVELHFSSAYPRQDLFHHYMNKVLLQ